MPIRKGGPGREETHSSNLERQCYGTECKMEANTEEKGKRQMSEATIELEQSEHQNRCERLFVDFNGVFASNLL